MPTSHKVRQGEDLFVIADAHGFRDYRTIYDDVANLALRVARPDPAILFPGDEVMIPDREDRIEEAATGRRHQFQVIRSSRVLRLRLLDAFDQPFVHEPYQLVIDGVLVPGDFRTDDDGALVHEIHGKSRAGSVTVAAYTWNIDIGSLDPVGSTPDDGVAGVQGRLFNLGYDVGVIDGVAGRRTLQAVREFQEDRALKVTGVIDDLLKAALVAAHGC